MSSLTKAGIFALLFASLACEVKPKIAQTDRSAQGDTTLRRPAGRRFKEALNPAKADSLQQRLIHAPPLGGADVVQLTGGVLEYELKRSYSGNYAGTPFNTNRWGMRDQDYDAARPPGVFRIVLLGSSAGMAPGVPEDQSFASLLEKKLNDDARLARSKQRYEILNFSVAGYSLLQNIVVAQRKIFSFHPNAVLVSLESADQGRLEVHLMRLVDKHVKIPYPELDSMLRVSGVDPAKSEFESEVKIRAKVRDLMSWHLKRLAETIRREGVPALAVVIPQANAGGKKRSKQRAERFASAIEDAGFFTLEVDDVFAGRAPDSLVYPPPNSTRLSPLAHRLIAETLDRALHKEAAALLVLPSQRDEQVKPTRSSSATSGSARK